MKELFFISCSILLSLTAASQSQYASTVIAFSTEWSPTSWSAAQTLGAPNTVGCGDITTAWASASADGAREFLVLGFTTPQTVNTINIGETWNPGAVDTIYLRNASNGVWNTVYTATAAPALPCPRTFSITIPTTPYNVDAIRLAINSPTVTSWNEIDAVEISLLCSLNVTSNDVFCNGMCNGSASATSSGPGPYTYLWTPGNYTTSAISSLCAGVYTVSVTDANSCTATSTVTINEPPILSVTINSSNPQVCFNSCNGSLTANPVGGTPGYTYSWSPGNPTSATATGLCAGSYTVTVTDQYGCSATASAIVTSYPAFTQNVYSTAVLCNGDCNGTASANFITGGCGSPYTYLWNPGGQTTQSISGLCVGSYTVTVTDPCGCTNTQTVNVGQPNLLVITPPSSATPETCPGCCDGTLNGGNPTGGTTPYSYMWAPMNYTTLNVTGVCPGTYTLCVTDANGCTTCNTVTVTASTLGEEEEISAESIKIFPNPSSGEFTIDLTDDMVGEVLVSIYDLSRKKVFFKTLLVRGNSIAVNSETTFLSNGIYELKIEATDKIHHAKAIICR